VNSLVSSWECVFMPWGQWRFSFLGTSTTPKWQDVVGVINLGRFMAFVGEMLDIIPKGLAWFLPATHQIPGVAWWHVCALEVAGEDLFEIFPPIDHASGNWSSQALAVLAS
jgi:hypothetical protein